ncbi:hypothetical protein bcgnr5402_12750 [Bacillus cereus]
MCCYTQSRKYNKKWGNVLNTIEDVLQSIKFDYEQTIQTAQFNGEQKPNGLEAKNV